MRIIRAITSHFLFPLDVQLLRPPLVKDVRRFDNSPRKMAFTYILTHLKVKVSVLINLSCATNVAKDANSTAVCPTLSLVEAKVQMFEMNNIINYDALKHTPPYRYTYQA